MATRIGFLLLFCVLYGWQAPLLAQQNASATTSADHLEPLRPPFGWMRQYTLMVQEVLFRGISDDQLVQFMSSPSFGAERVLVIEIDMADRKNPLFTLVFHRATSSIWHSLQKKEPEEIRVETFRKPISREHALKVEDLYAAALARVCESNRMGMDGNSYYFYTSTQGGRAWTGGVLTGKNKVERLILLSRELEKLTQGDASVQIDADLVQQIDVLTQEFRG